MVHVKYNVKHLSRFNLYLNAKDVFFGLLPLAGSEQTYERLAKMPSLMQSDLWPAAWATTAPKNYSYIEL